MKEFPESKKWQLQEAKAKFSELVETAQHGGPMIITKNGKEVAVLLSKREYERISKPSTTLLQFFENAPCQEFDLEIKRSSKDLGRKIKL